MTWAEPALLFVSFELGALLGIYLLTWFCELDYSEP
jgi:hypothetical protein